MSLNYIEIVSGMLLYTNVQGKKQSGNEEPKDNAAFVTCYGGTPLHHNDTFG